MEWYFESSVEPLMSSKTLFDNSFIRLLEIPHIMSNTPDNDFFEKLHWDVCSQSVKQFSTQLVILVSI